MSERRAILSGSTFEEQIGYARAVTFGDFVHISGTTGFDYEAMTTSEDIVAQARQALRNIECPEHVTYLVHHSVIIGNCGS